MDERKKPRSIPFVGALIGSGGEDWIGGSRGKELPESGTSKAQAKQGTAKHKQGTSRAKQ